MNHNVIIMLAKEAGFEGIYSEDAMDMIGGVFVGDENITENLAKFAQLVFYFKHTSAS